MGIQSTYILKNIRDQINSRGLKCSKVANDIGMSKSNFSAMLTGRKILRPEYLPGIAESIGCTYNDIFRVPEQT